MQSARKHFESRRAALKSERSSWDTRARDISEFQFPELGRFTNSPKNDGRSKRHKIINNMVSRAALVTRAGMLAGLTSPSRPWVRITTADPGLARFQPARVWLDTVSAAMLQAFAVTNTYKSLGKTFMESALFGTNVLWMNDDVEDIFRFYNTTWGEFMLGASSRGDVDSCYREYSMTVWSLAERFGVKNLSTETKALYDRGQYDTWIDVVHLVEPHAEDLEGVGFKLKQFPYREVYYEKGTKVDKFLDVKGYDHRPFFAPRWDTVSTDIYGAYCPGILALGDSLELQHHELLKAKAQEMMTDPPILAPVEQRMEPINIGPAGVTRYASADGAASIAPLFNVRFDVEHSRASIADIEQRIQETFYVDLFRTVMDVRSRSISTQITAREIDQLEKEGLIQLGPVLESFDDELNDPMIELTFKKMLKNGNFPPPPQDLLGAPLRVEYISTIHQAQKLIGLQPFDRVHQFVGAMAQAKGDVVIWDVVDEDQAVRDYADLAGYPARLMRAPQDVAAIRQQRQAVMQAQQTAELANSAADTAKTLSVTETDPSQDTALTRIAKMAPRAMAGAR